MLWAQVYHQLIRHRALGASIPSVRPLKCKISMNYIYFISSFIFGPIAYTLKERLSNLQTAIFPKDSRNSLRNSWFSWKHWSVTYCLTEANSDKFTPSKSSNPAGAGIFSVSSHTSDLKIGTPVATLPGAWRHKVSTGTGRPGVSIL